MPKPGGHPSKIRSLVPLRNKTSRLLITSAAIAGLYAGSLASNAFAAAEKSAADKGKHDCKGTGGCGAGDNGCKGKNSCKGKGGCKTATKSDKKAEAKKS